MICLCVDARACVCVSVRKSLLPTSYFLINTLFCLGSKNGTMLQFCNQPVKFDAEMRKLLEFPCLELLSFTLCFGVHSVLDPSLPSCHINTHHFYFLLFLLC